MRRVLSSILSVLAVAGGLIVALVLIATLASTEGSSAVAREAQVSLDAEVALSATGAVRNATAQAVFLEQGRVAGWADAGSVTQATNQILVLIDEFDRRTEVVLAHLEGDEIVVTSAAVGAFITEIRDTHRSLAGVPGAEARASDFPVESFDRAVASLVEVRDSRVEGVIAEAEYAGQVADAVRFLVIVAIPLAAMIVLRSVSRRRREREVLQAELKRQHDVIGSKDEFVSNLSHELKTPLTGVYGFALALDESGFDDNEAAEELTGMIVAEAGELTRMVDDLITAGQVDTGNLQFSVESVDIDPEVEAVIGAFTRSGARIDFSGTGETIDVDRLRFRQILLNLVSNAVKHGGETIEVFTEYGAGNLSIFVMDDGDGIDDDQLTSVFDRYQHEGDEPLLQGSVGLGLAVAKSLTTAMGGTLTYTRTNGLTYFVLRLPALRVGKLTERVEDGSLGKDSARQSTTEVSAIFGR